MPSEQATSATLRWAVPAIAVGAVLLRLPYVVAPAGNDEAGYLAVARQWHAGGSSLYGEYWVDRPPLLVALFQVADALGDIPGLRVIAALGVGVAVLGAAATARRIAGPRAAVGTAAVATALFVSPMIGVVQINGEILAAPFVAWALALGLRALDRSQARHSGSIAFGAGALAVAALLVKQNMAEPVIFGAVVALVAARRGLLAPGQLRQVLAGAVAGATAALILVGAWTVGHGTSLGGVFEAMYPFRLHAASVLAGFPDAGQTRRSHHFLMILAVSGILLVLAVYAWSVLRRRVVGPAVWGLSAALTWGAASILLGGGFWDHYLIELIVPVSIAAGLCAAGVRTGPAPARFGRWVPSGAVALVLVVAGVQWGTGLSSRSSAVAAGVGTAIAGSAVPGDTLVTAFGSAQVVESADLPSPYPYLWTLPAQVRDPKLNDLTALLRGPNAPTWFVDWGRASFPAAVLARLHQVVTTLYRQAGTVCGRVVYLLKGLERPALASPSCSAREALATRSFSLGRGPS